MGLRVKGSVFWVQALARIANVEFGLSMGSRILGWTARHS